VLLEPYGYLLQYHDFLEAVAIHEAKIVEKEEEKEKTEISESGESILEGVDHD
jgi:hypothetical protein